MGSPQAMAFDYTSWLAIFDYLLVPYLDTKSLLGLGSSAWCLSSYRRAVRKGFRSFIFSPVVVVGRATTLHLVLALLMYSDCSITLRG